MGKVHILHGSQDGLVHDEVFGVQGAGKDLKHPFVCHYKEYVDRVV